MPALHHRRRRTATLAATGVAALVGTGIFIAAPASAHTPNWSVDCSSVSVNLTNYSEKETNTVHVTVDGKDLLPSENFGGGFQKKLDLPDHDKEVTVRLIVKANDGDQHNVDETKTAPVCEEESPEPTPTPTESTPEETPAPSESTPAETPSSEAPAESAPAAEPAGDKSTAPADLAETGSSSNTGMIAGIAAAVVAAGGALLLVARKRRSVRD